MNSQYREIRPNAEPPPEPERPHVGRLGRRTVTSVACDRCRRQKAKCDGRRPSCSRCIKDPQQLCAYGVGENETRSNALKRSLDNLRNKHGEYEELYRYLRSRPEQEAQEIFRRVRTSQDVSDVVRYVRDGDLLIQEFQRASNVYDINARRGSSPFQVELANLYPNVFMMELPSAAVFAWPPDRWPVQQSLVGTSGSAQSALTASNHQPRSDQPVTIDFSTSLDPRIQQSTCLPWTSIIEDDELFHKLLKIYFAWIHPTFSFFEQDAFLDDLVHEGEEYCTPLLVNAILCMAFFHYALLVRGKESSADTSLGYALQRESRRLFYLREDEQSLAMFQGVTAMALAHQYAGKDKIGMLHFAHAWHMAVDLGYLNVSHAQDVNPAFAFARKQTSWGLYQIYNLASFALHKPSIFYHPPKGNPYEDNSRRHAMSILGSRYPYIESLRPASPLASFMANRKLWILAADLTNRRYGADSLDPPTLEHAERFHTQLLSWATSIPDDLKPHRDSPPHVLLLHNWFHLITIENFQPFVEPSVHQFPIIAPPPLSSLQRSRIVSITNESIRQMKMLLLLFSSNFDTRLVPLSLITSILTIAFHTKASMTKNAEDAKLFMLCFQITEEYSHSFVICRPIVRLLREIALKIFNGGTGTGTETSTAAKSTSKEEERAKAELRQNNRTKVRGVVLARRKDAKGNGEDDMRHWSVEELKSSLPIDLDNVSKDLSATRVDSLIRAWKEQAEDESSTRGETI